MAEKTIRVTVGKRVAAGDPDGPRTYYYARVGTFWAAAPTLRRAVAALLRDVAGSYLPNLN